MTDMKRQKLLNKLKKKSKGAYTNARKAAAQAKGARLPAGIMGGTAKFSEWKMAENKKGNVYFVLTGIVQTPEKYKGKKAQVMHTMSETQTKSIEDKYEQLVSDIKLLAPERTEDIENGDIEDLVSIIAETCEAEPIFEFNTWAPDDRPNDPFVFIQGLAEVDDEGEEEEEEEYERDEEELPYEEEEGSEEEEEDSEEEEASEEDWVPGVGETYRYQPKGAKAPLRVEIMEVDEEAETCSVKTPKGRTYKDVGFGSLMAD